MVESKFSASPTRSAGYGRTPTACPCADFAQAELTKPYLISQGHARDISISGLRIETSDALPEGSDVLVRILLPLNSTPLNFPGR